MVDSAIAVLIAGIALIEIWVPLESRQGEASELVSTVGALFFAGALAVRRAFPWWALAGLLVWPVLGAVVGPDNVHLLFFGQMVPLLVLVFTIARQGRGRYLWVGTLGAALFLTVGDLFVELLQEPTELAFHWAFVTLIWLVGRGLRVSADHAAAEAVRAHRAETTSREAALRAISDERARIARELHDIVAHSVGVIVVQAGAAEQVVEDDPEFARRALATIRATGSGALVEMRRVVTMLRDPDLGHDLAPQPGIAALPDLVTSARDAGLRVDLEVTGERPPLPAGLDLTAYRVVQEALTNVRRHSEATCAQVAMSFVPGALEIAVSDAGPSRASDQEPGHGLLGMRERVALFGGQVETDTTGGVFTVRAVLPLERA